MIIHSTRSLLSHCQVAPWQLGDQADGAARWSLQPRGGKPCHQQPQTEETCRDVHLCGLEHLWHRDQQGGPGQVWMYVIFSVIIQPDFSTLYLTSFLILLGICHMLIATSYSFEMIICLTYLHLFSSKVAIKNKQITKLTPLCLFSYVFLMQCSFGGVSPGGKRPSICQRRTGSGFAVCPSESLARYERSPMCLIWKSHSCESSNLSTCVCLTLCRGGDLPLDLQWVPSFPANRSPAICLPKNGEPLHLQSWSSGCRKLFLLCFQSNDWQKCLLQVHPSHPFTPWWRSVNSGCATT